MFTVGQIEEAHSKIKSAAEFPNYIQEIREIGVTSFETWVRDSHTKYFGIKNFKILSKAKYEELKIADFSNKKKFEKYLNIHQMGKTDYYTFCKHCAETGIEKWIVNLSKMTCTYYDKAGNKILIEKVPTV